MKTELVTSLKRRATGIIAELVVEEERTLSHADAKKKMSRWLK